MTFSTDWDATHLATSPGFEVSFEAAPDAQSSYDDLGSQTLPVAAGSPGNDTLSANIPVGDSGGFGNVTVNSPSTQSGFNFSAASVPLTCPSLAQTSVAPTYSISPMDCAGNVTISVDGSATTQDWQATLFPPGGGFDPVSASITAGQSTSFVVSGGTSADVGKAFNISYGFNTNTSYARGDLNLPITQVASCSPSGGGGGTTPPPTTSAPSCANGNPFTDVTTANQLCDDIAWAKAKGIAAGNTDGTFQPAAAVSRQAMAAFLYRYTNPNTTAAACTGKPFTDVRVSSPFCADIAALKASGAIAGYADGGFHPGAAVSRQATSAFLYRLANPGKTAAACTTAAFSDVPASSQFCADINYLVTEKVTTGYSDGGFHPTEAVTRQAMAAFLHRLYTATH